MAQSIITGIDVGSARVRVIVCEYSVREGTFSLRALVKVSSNGLRNGYIINAESVAQSINLALRETERVGGLKIRKALLSVGGVGLGTVIDSGTVAVSRADSVVSEMDVARLVNESEARVAERPNHRILHTIPSEFKVDGKKILGKPHGYVGNKLELRTTFITCSAPHLDALVGAVEACGVLVSDVYAAPVAENLITLSSTGRNAGVALANIGAETISLLTCEDGLPTSLKVFPLGSSDITNDIALGLRIGLEQAEELKVSGTEDKKISKHVTEITEARISDIFELIDTHLKKIGRSALLPAGITFSGEGAHAPGLEDLARKQLALPARIARNIIPEELSPVPGEPESKGAGRARERLERARDPEWSVALGLAILGMSSGPEESLGIRVAKRTKTGIVKFLKQFLP